MAARDNYEGIDACFDRIENPVWQKATKQYTFYAVKQPNEHRIFLAGPEEGELAVLALNQGHSPFGLVEKDKTSVVSSGLMRLCSSLLGIINQDQAWQNFHDQMRDVQYAHDIALVIDEGSEPQRHWQLGRFHRGLALLGYNLAGFLALPDEKRAEITRSFLDRLRPEVERHPTVSIAGTNYLKALTFKGARLFTHQGPCYNSFNSDGVQLIGALEVCLEMARRYKN